MAAIKTIDFLPAVFQTDTNRKFLNATLDQLVSEPNFKKINGYVGRKFAPTYKAGDNYLPEPTDFRQSYQLEPGVVIENKGANTIDHYSGYIDLLQKLDYYGAVTSDHSRMFNSESYSFDGLFDFDKFVNFNNYYWLPNGPDSVDVFAGAVETQATFTVSRNTATGYNFTGTSTESNPVITLARGGTYRFSINQPGAKFWIQSNPGTSGTLPNRPNVTTRNVFGVTNNGTDSGDIIFSVPLATAQDRFIKMNLVDAVDISTSIDYSKIQNRLLSEFFAEFPDGIDGVKTNLANKKIIFAGTDIDATLEYYVNYNGVYAQVPIITSNLDRLYYQDGSANGMVGEIKLVDPGSYTIDVTNDIIGQSNYTSPNGVIFTNGLKVSFDSTVVPSEYAGNEYYVEGVGTGIKLVSVAEQLIPDTWASNGLASQDYITINRYSIDSNPWSRSNRWFHISVIDATANYNGTTSLPSQTQRANRPIIEFESNLQLFNFGKVAKTPIDILDLSITDAFSQIEGQVSATLQGVPLTNGMRVVFSAEQDPLVKNKIYVVSVIDIDGLPETPTQIHLTEATDSTILAGNTLVALQGSNAGSSYWFNGTSWIEGQVKSGVNQEPLFDVFDSNNNSFADTSVYLNSSFAGSKIFSYKVGTGIDDTVLGFPLSYKNFNSVGDIEFINDFDSEVVTYLSGQDTLSVPVNNGFLYQNQDLTNSQHRNVWTKIAERTKQYQITSTVYTGQTNYVEIDVLPADEATIPYVKVFVNNVLLNSSQYSIKKVGPKYAVVITASLLTVNDKIDIAIYSTDTSNIAYYETPDNLEFNPLNVNFDSLTLGQLRNHVDAIKKNTKVITDYNGTFTGLRDIKYKENGGNILQHGDPLIFSNLFLVDKTANFVEGTNFATREYTKFKNKFLELAVKLPEVTSSDIPGSVDTILKSINLVKNKDFPWYYSDMVPYGDNKNTITYTIVNPLIKQYQISKVFDDTKLSNTAVLVYLNDVQLTKGLDYYFPQDRAAIILYSGVTVQPDDVLTIIEYLDTDGSYIPETPTKLGLYPSYRPSKYIDDTYQTPINVVRGHDGSIIPAFNDYRDDLLIELEKRIYNNIKINFETNILELYDFIPGRFRNTEYTLAEFNRVLTRNFLKWAGNNRVDFSSNTYFQSNNGWTWNYKKLPDSISGAQLPGTWRAIYNHWFDTDRPHTHPWEMLGFSEMPTWWEDRYGPAPYTGGNTLLWSDLSQGYIYGGARAGYDSRFVRPGLLNHVPVDEYGQLISPEKFAVGSFSSEFLNSNFAIGDQGPVETAWRRSSDFPFALQQAIALLKPAFYFGALINISDYYRDTTIDQLVRNDTKQRITPTTVCINGETLTNGNIQRCAGYLNWVTDYIHSHGLNGTVLLRNMLTELDVRLGYKVAGYTDQKYIKVLAEQSSPTSTNNSIIIPDENYRVHLHKSTQVKKATYSAVIIQRTESGYSVSGYNTSSPFFTIIPSLANNNSYTITALNQRGIIYRDFQTRKVTVPYGFEFKTRQQVVDFLVSYGRYLTGIGYRFDQTDDSLKAQRDWILSAQEFLTWSQQGWKSGNLIVLSPIYNEVKFVNADGTVDFVENTSYGSKILDHGFNIIKSNQFTVVRDDNEFRLTTLNGQTVCLVELDVVQYEHALLFDNTTVFSDVIYKPELGNRQYRLKIVGHKTADWTGKLNPPGFVYNTPNVDTWQPGVDYRKGSIVSFKDQYYTALSNLIATSDFNQTDWQVLDRLSIKTGLLPNFAYNAQKFENIYDIDNQPVDSGLDAYSNGLIGFRNRNYLSDFSLDQISQAKFYQGYIKEKGTINAVTGLTNAQFNNITSDITIYEEWALRVGEYGAIESDQVLEVLLPESQYSINDPSGLVLLDSLDPDAEAGFSSIRNKDLYRRPTNYKKDIFFNRDENSIYDNDALTAGYVNLNDVDGTLYYFSYYADLDKVINNLGKGYKLWVARNFDNLWDVYRVNETNLSVTSLTYGLDGFMTVQFNVPHTLQVGDIFAFKNVDPQFNGFYQVTQVTGTDSVSVFIHKNDAVLKKLGTIGGVYGPMFTLNSMRVTKPTDVIGITPLHGWIDGDRVWVDNFTNGNWGVLEKGNPWNFKSYVLPQVSEFAEELNFGTSTKISSTTDLIVVGAPGKNEVKTFTKTPAGEFIQTNNLKPQNDNIAGFGKSLDVSDYVVAVGAPDTANGQGAVYVFSVGPTGSFNGQILIDAYDGKAGDGFGTSLALSQDNQWLYVGCPGENCVYAYKLVTDVPIASNELSADGVLTSFNLSFAPVRSTSITVSTNTKRFIPELDYKISGSTITFYAGDGTTLQAPAADTIVVSQSTYYKFISKITGSDSVTGDQFGLSLQTNVDGSEIYVGAPNQAVVGNLHAGAVYVFSRRSESFRTVTGINTFVPQESCDANTTVTLNGALQVANVDYQIIDQTVRFFNAPDAGRIVNVTQATFDFVQKLTQDVVVPNSKFGSSITVDHTSSNLFVGAPMYTEPTYQTGAIYRFADPAKVTGYAIGSITNPTTTTGDAIFINGFRVQFTDSTVDSVANDINNVNIPGVSANVVNGQISIVSTSSSSLKLWFRDYGNTGSTSLGLAPFQVTQVIKHPDFGKGETFGKMLALNETGSTLLVASEGASTFKNTTFDSGATTYDQVSTFFVDQVKDSGAVYQYELLKDAIESIADTGSYVYAQQLSDSNINKYDHYGYSIDIVKSFIVVGAPGNDAYTSNGGLVHLYENATGNNCWQVIKQQNPRVDLDSVNRLFVYDTTTNTILNNLDFIDPVKGKILGIAEQDIDYKTSFDPASYNHVVAWSDVTSTYNTNYYWNNEQVGRVWWDLSTVRYFDYEQDSLTYRQKNWGSAFPGSSIDVYEWVESNDRPSVYQTNGGDGVPRWVDDESYSVVTNVDSTTGVISTKYYFWVKNKKNTAPAGKSNSTAAIADIISKPHLQGVPYATILQSNAIGLHGIKDMLRSSDIALHVDYANVRNANTIHSEFELISENTNVLPEKIINKLIDSLAGLDKLGQVVPDNTLSVVDRLGISVRPRQTMISNKAKALENFVRYANSVFATYPIAVRFNLTNLYAEEPLPDNTLGDQWQQVAATAEELSYIDTTSLSNGYKVLVETDSTNNGLWTIYVLTDAGFVLSRIQSYKTSLYWKKVDWYDSTYDPTTKVNYLVNEVKDIAKLRLVANTTIKVRYGSTGLFEIYVVNSDLTLTLVGLEQGTIELQDIIYNLPKGKMSYDEDNFDNIRYDQTPSLEIRQIITAIKDDIFIGELKSEFNKLFFIVIDYILAEQKSVDWIFKTSFINVVHKLRKLEQFPSFIKDNQDYYLDYINEVKPYRTQVREYLLDYSGNDYYYGDMTDFDLPSYYDTVTKTYRSPNGEQAGDSVRLNQTQYANWKNNFTYSIDSIVVDKTGTGFVTVPEIKIVGGGGTGATAEAQVNYDTGEITSIVITNAGSGYTSTPTVTINGTGTGASAYPRLVNNKTRKFDSTLKFDRITYSSDVVNWQADVAYPADTIVSFDNVAWKANVDIDALDHFDYNNFVKVTGDYFDNAADRILAYYKPTVGLAAASIPQLLSGVEYPGVKVQGLPFSANTDITANAALIDTYIQSTYKDANLGIRTEDINIDGGAYVDRFNSHAPEELVPGIIFDSLNLEVYTREIDTDGNVVADGTTLGMRIFSGMLHDTKYYRIPGANVATLSSNLNITDSNVFVTDASVLPEPGFELTSAGTWIIIPGQVFINGEKVMYYKRNLGDNSLGQIRRAVDGTGAPAVHVAGTKVVDTSVAQELAFAANTWVTAPSYGDTTIGNTSATFSSINTITGFLMENPSITP